MKKLIIFLFIIALVTGSLTFADKTTQIFDVSGVEEVCFVSDDEFDGEFEHVSCGDKIFNYCTFEEAKKNLALVKQSDSVQFYTDESEIDSILKKIHFEKLSSEEVEGIQISYGYSPSYKKFVYVDGKKVNVQVAKTADGVIVGFPIILTGY